MRGIQDLQQGSGWVAMKARAELVDFIEHEDGVSAARLSDSLNDITRKRADIRTPMPPNIGFIVDAA